MTFLKICLGVITFCQIFNLVNYYITVGSMYRMYNEIKPLLEKLKGAIKIFVPDEKLSNLEN